MFTVDHAYWPSPLVILFRDLYHPFCWCPSLLHIRELLSPNHWNLQGWSCNLLGLYHQLTTEKSFVFQIWLLQICPFWITSINIARDCGQWKVVRVSNVSFWLQESTETSSIKCQLWIIFDVISGFHRKRLRKYSLLACMLSARWWIVRTKVLIGLSLYCLQVRARTVISLYQVGVGRRARSTRRAVNVAKEPLRLLESVYKNLDNILNISTHAPLPYIHTPPLMLLEVLQTGLDGVRPVPGEGECYCVWVGQTWWLSSHLTELQTCYCWGHTTTGPSGMDNTQHCS